MVAFLSIKIPLEWVPDWFQFQFKKRQGRSCVLFADYRIEVMKTQVETVAEAHNVSGLRSEVSFEPVGFLTLSAAP